MSGEPTGEGHFLLIAAAQSIHPRARAAGLNAQNSNLIFGELGFVFPPFPYVAHSRGWSAEDMQNNVRFVRKSDDLRVATAELAQRSLAMWKLLAAGASASTPLGMGTPVAVTGRKGGRGNDRPGG